MVQNTGMEGKGGKPPLHDLVGDALIRAARLQEESRMALESLRMSTATLEHTVEMVHRRRAARELQRPPPRHPPK